MNTEQQSQIWSGKGFLWQNISLHMDGNKLIGKLENSQCFIADQEIPFEESVGIEEAVNHLMKKDYDFHSELELYADEG